MINVIAMQGKVQSQLVFGGISFCWEESWILPLKSFGTAGEKSILLVGRVVGTMPGHAAGWKLGWLRGESTEQRLMTQEG